VTDTVSVDYLSVGSVAIWLPDHTTLFIPNFVVLHGTRSSLNLYDNLVAALSCNFVAMHDGTSSLIVTSVFLHGTHFYCNLYDIFPGALVAMWL
jgi:hypothetical protein